MPDYAKVCQGIPEYALEYAKVCLKYALLKYAKICLECAVARGLSQK